MTAASLCEKLTHKRACMSAYRQITVVVAEALKITIDPCESVGAGFICVRVNEAALNKLRHECDCNPADVGGENSGLVKFQRRSIERRLARQGMDRILASRPRLSSTHHRRNNTRFKHNSNPIVKAASLQAGNVGAIA